MSTETHCAATPPAGSCVLATYEEERADAPPDLRGPWLHVPGYVPPGCEDVGSDDDAPLPERLARLLSKLWRPGDGGLPALEAAPGSYVKNRLK